MDTNAISGLLAIIWLTYYLIKSLAQTFTPTELPREDTTRHGRKR
jgi:hypothetical protein